MTVPDNGRLRDRWTTRDRPILLELAQRLDDQPGVGIDSRHLATELGMDPGDVAAACVALDPEYIGGKAHRAAGHGVILYIATELKTRGRREVRLWPSGENVDALLDALRQAEDLTDDAEEKGIIRRAAGAVGMVSRDVMVDVMAAVVARQAGLT